MDGAAAGELASDYPISGLGTALVCAVPLTGRTHQIRLHLAHSGLPIVGDDLYGWTHACMPRQALHAHTLRFQACEELMAGGEGKGEGEDDGEGEREGKGERPVEFEAPMPQDMRACSEALGMGGVGDVIIADRIKEALAHTQTSSRHAL